MIVPYALHHSWDDASVGNIDVGTHFARRLTTIEFKSSRTCSTTTDATMSITEVISFDVPELTMGVFSRLTLQDLLAVALVSKKWANFAFETIWRHHPIPLSQILDKLGPLHLAGPECDIVSRSMYSNLLIRY